MKYADRSRRQNEARGRYQRKVTDTTADTVLRPTEGEDVTVGRGLKQIRNFCFLLSDAAFVSQTLENI